MKSVCRARSLSAALVELYSNEELADKLGTVLIQNVNSGNLVAW
jgi:hypothetical protein